MLRKIIIHILGCQLVLLEKSVKTVVSTFLGYFLKVAKNQIEILKKDSLPKKKHPKIKVNSVLEKLQFTL